MPKKAPISRAKIFNIDIEARKLYPKEKPNYQTNNLGYVYSLVKAQTVRSSGPNINRLNTFRQIAA